MSLLRYVEVVDSDALRIGRKTDRARRAFLINNIHNGVSVSEDTNLISICFYRIDVGMIWQEIID